MSRFAAVDLGASSGRVMLADITIDKVALREVHRFPNRPIVVHGTLQWDVLALWAGVLDGLRDAGADGPIDGIGVDSWAIDYALLDSDGRLLGNPIHYRDRRTDGIAEQVGSVMSMEKLYARTGVQILPFNTVFQLVAARESAAMHAAAQLLLIPDLFNYWLSAYAGAELTNASTTGLLDVRTRAWSTDVCTTLDLRADLLPQLVEPGTPLGTLTPKVAADTGVRRGMVFAVGSHDTASAVLGVPARNDRFAYISCGTWSLVGVEVDAPVISEDARIANFSNELGVDGTVRFLRNVMGLWLLQESIRTWEHDGERIRLDRLLAEAEQVPPRRFLIDPDRPEFLPPGDMPSRIRAECLRIGRPEPQTPAEITRCILDSLADAYRRAITEAARLSGIDVEVVHLVGGGANNALLCQLTADACGLPVIAGPVEATAYGNVLLQARAAGAVTGDRYRLRELLHPIDTTTYGARQ
ncbi:MAG TPA: rhamnulokinase family protein [Micromonosporaceae bacterium]|nr:rhamnulokinase family protein [Micromonosporaceae bacterium]